MSVGIVFFILIMLLFLFVYSLSEQYAGKYKELKELSGVVEKYALKKNLYNEHWITAKEEEAELYDQELEKCKLFFKEKDTFLEAIFLQKDSEKGLVEIKDEALWKNEYRERTLALVSKLNENDIFTSKKALPLHSWGTSIPSWDSILPVQKEFWILDMLVNSIVNHTGITRVEEIRFRETPRRYDSAYEQLYSTIPFTMNIEIQAEYIQFFLRKILKSKIPFVIENLNIFSTDKAYIPADRIESDEDLNLLKNESNSRSSRPILSITIDAYAIDYKT